MIKPAQSESRMSSDNLFWIQLRDGCIPLWIIVEVAAPVLLRSFSLIDGRHAWPGGAFHGR